MTTSFFGETCEVIEVENYNLTHKAFERNGHDTLKGTYDVNQTKKNILICIHVPTCNEGGFVTIISF
jgi:hypothetical protein